jgi:HSP20 family protein
LYDDPVSIDRTNGAAELADDARRLLDDIEREVPGAAAVNADCRPPLDVFETSSAIEVVVDVPGVPPESIRIVARRSTLLIVGAKLVPPTDGQARFHVAERSHGRFARAVRLSGAFDIARATAAVRHGELHIVLPRLDDRRGRVFTIPVTRA